MHVIWYYDGFFCTLNSEGVAPRKGPTKYEDEPLDPELERKIKSLDDEGLEPNLDEFANAYDEYQK